MKTISVKQSRRNTAGRRRKVAARHGKAGHWRAQSKPMFGTGRMHYEVGTHTDAMCYGGIAAIHRLVTKLGLAKTIDATLKLLKVHLPYHESDHVLNLAYNVLCGGTRLEDIERLRHDTAYMNALGAELIPDPTTAGLNIDSSEEVELSTFDMYAMLPSGTTLALADREAQRMDARVADIEELTERSFDIQAEEIHLSFELKERFQEIARRNLGMIKSDILERLRSGFPKLNISFDQPSTGQYQGGGNAAGTRAFQRLLGIGGGEERVILRGNDLELMQTVADDIRYNLERLPGVAAARAAVSKGQPEIELAFHKAATAHFGVAPEAIAAALSDFQSQLSSQVRLKRGVDEIEVVLSSTGHPPRQVEDLRQLQVITESGGGVPLLHLADLRYAHGYGQVNRVNQQKEVAVGYSFEREVTASKELLEGTRAAVDRLAADFNLPVGMSIEVEHDEADLADFYFLIGATVLLIYMILAAVFESLVAPLSMMITLPLAATGALWALILTGDTIYNANALVGFLILLGVVVNNGIILIDYARLLQQRGYRLGRALLAAGQVRVRPILITALSTILAMLPLAMGNAEYVAQIGAPFATAVIGGLDPK